MEARWSIRALVSPWTLSSRRLSNQLTGLLITAGTDWNQQHLQFYSDDDDDEEEGAASFSHSVTLTGKKESEQPECFLPTSPVTSLLQTSVRRANRRHDSALCSHLMCHREKRTSRVQRRKNSEQRCSVWTSCHVRSCTVTGHVFMFIHQIRETETRRAVLTQRSV